MGKLGSEPYCPCEMRKRGMPSSADWTEEEIRKFEQMFEEDLGDENENNNLEQR
jgi:hypothetical protein